YIHVLKESPIPEKVVFGKEDWLFLGDSYNSVYSSSIGIRDYSISEINHICENIIEIQDFFESLDIDFYLFIASNKGTIYPEYLKPNYSNNLPRKVTLVLNNLPPQRTENIIDLTEYIIEQKERDILYYMNDTHWNAFAAFLATKQILDKIGKDHDVKEISEDDFYIEKNWMERHLDLAKMLNTNRSDNYFEVTPKIKPLMQDTMLKDGDYVYLHHFVNESSENTTTCFVIRDSFSNLMMVPLNYSINKASYFKYLNRNDILNEIERVGKPDFILYEIVERNFHGVKLH
ncbi:hypothetical protein LJB95_03425, partial [Paludibacteraceae bacterium OttesenSCG-928-F17]|nr:hypothetical protein [Paludibacteraceae bacterium OttesenSCG-928-F17]